MEYCLAALFWQPRCILYRSFFGRYHQQGDTSYHARRQKMKSKMTFSLRIGAILLVVSASLVVLSAVSAFGQNDGVGAVFTMTNEVSGNSVRMFGRSARGLLTDRGSFPTGG